LAPHLEYAQLEMLYWAPGQTENKQGIVFTVADKVFTAE
jgi:hypothetical protein